VVLDHAFEKQPIELGALGGCQRRHLVGCEHAGHHPAGHVMRVLVGQRRAARGEPAAHHLDLVLLRHVDAHAELLHVVALRVRRDQRDHLHGLRVMADHPLHELDVGGGGANFREVGGLPHANDTAGLTRCARLQDRRGLSLRRGPGATRRLAGRGGHRCKHHDGGPAIHKVHQ
jgi:hypothetical protein